MGLVNWFRPPRVVFTLFVGLMRACAMALVARLAVLVQEFFDELAANKEAAIA